MTMKLFAKVPKVYVQWVDYKFPTWEPLYMIVKQKIAQPEYAWDAPIPYKLQKQGRNGHANLNSAYDKQHVLLLIWGGVG
eukprot:7314342-Ditylum_brightwellii.AAC.1